MAELGQMPKNFWRYAENNLKIDTKTWGPDGDICITKKKVFYHESFN